MARKFTAVFLIALMPLILLAAATQVDWTQIKNKPAFPAGFWNDPGSGTLLKRTGAFTFAAAVSGTDYQAALGFTPENSANRGAVNGYAPLNASSQVPAANLPSAWNDPGSGTILKRTGAFTFAAAGASDYPVCVASGASHAPGVVPDPGASAGTTKFLREDCTFAVPPNPTININSRAHNSANISIPNNSGTVLTFDTNDFDNGGVHSTVTNTSRFTVPTSQGGIYVITGEVEFAASSGGTSREVFIEKNGTTVWSHQLVFPAGATNPTRVNVSAILSLAATDYIEFWAFQDSGGALNAVTVSTYGSVVRVN